MAFVLYAQILEKVKRNDSKKNNRRGMQKLCFCVIEAQRIRAHGNWTRRTQKLLL